MKWIETSKTLSEVIEWKLSRQKETTAWKDKTTIKTLPKALVHNWIGLLGRAWNNDGKQLPISHYLSLTQVSSFFFSLEINKREIEMEGKKEEERRILYTGFA